MRSILLLLSCWWTALFLISAKAEEDSTTSATNDNAQCGLYLAVSSTSTTEATNWGLFLGKDVKGVGVPLGSPEIGIVVSHLRVQNENLTSQYLEYDLDHLVSYFESFFWVPATAGARHELGSGRAIAAIPGAGVLASYSKKRTNTDWDPAHVYRRPVQGEVTGAPHPQRGAISPFYHCQVVTTVPHLTVGSELFMEYGESWADEQEDDDSELTQEDYAKMDETVHNMIQFFDKYKDTLDTDGAMEIYGFLTKDIMKAAVGVNKARRIATILPPNPYDLHLVPAAGGTLAFSDPTAHRSLSWLQKYGLCIDNIYSGPSTLPNVGRGAFASRAIPAGGLIVPVPLTHVPDKSIFNVHPLTLDAEGNYVRASDQVISQQLIVNYCFGHPESSMLFFPSGSVTSLINHADNDAVNAKITWSSHTNHQKMWFQFEPATLMEEEYLYMGLVFEIVATRDIAPGEEIFLDYGPEWKAAYEKHVAVWNKKIQDGTLPKEWPVRAVDLNAQFHHTDGLPRLPFDPTTLPQLLPSHVMLMAFLLLEEDHHAGTMDDPKRWNRAERADAFATDHLFEVTLIAQQVEDNGANYSYTVQWMNGNGELTIVTLVPHDALVFVDRPGSSDQFTAPELVFRHSIGIPDDVFPQGPWRNVQKMK
jgi:SET domain